MRTRGGVFGEHDELWERQIVGLTVFRSDAEFEQFKIRQREIGNVYGSQRFADEDYAAHPEAYAFEPK